METAELDTVEVRIPNKAAAGIFGFGVLIGMIFGGLVSAVIVSIPPQYDHDPQKLLELRAKCLATDTTVSAAWCNDYAERYSRIEPK